MKFFIATKNAHKLREFLQIFEGTDVQIISENDLSIPLAEAEETGTTFEENAIQKARFINDKYGYDCFADDSGLEVVALNNAPGVYSARYAGEPSNSQRNIEKLMYEMRHIENRKARFRTCIALIMDGAEFLFDGCIEGSITDTLRGNNGFGYDPIFVPEGYDVTFAEMSSEVKNNISHRALATQRLVEYLLRK